MHDTYSYRLLQIMPKTALVTGAAGFLGSHLCTSLLKDGYTVIGLDNLMTGSRANVRAIAAHPKFRFVKHDVVKPLRLKAVIDDVYHFASPASPVQYQKHPLATIQTNTLGTLNVLAFAHARGARVLHASTSEIYGDPQVHPQVEEYVGAVNPIGPRACYDEGKRVAETICFEYIRQYHADVKVIRIFNTYGPHMAADDGRVISNFVVAALAGKPIRVDGDGSQTRSFCYVSDLVSGIRRMMRTKKSIHGPINLGNPDEYTIKEIAETICALADSKSAIQYTNTFRTDDPMRRQPDITKAKTLLQWQPRVSLADGLRETIAYFRAVR